MELAWAEMNADIHCFVAAHQSIWMSHIFRMKTKNRYFDGQWTDRIWHIHQENTGWSWHNSIQGRWFTWGQTMPIEKTLSNILNQTSFAFMVSKSPARVSQELALIIQTDINTKLVKVCRFIWTWRCQKRFLQNLCELSWEHQWCEVSNQAGSILFSLCTSW